MSAHDPADPVEEGARQTEPAGSAGVNQQAQEEDPEVSIDDASLGKLARALLAFAYEQLEKRQP